MFTTYIEYVFILLRKFLSIYPELYQSLAETTIIFAAQISILTTNTILFKGVKFYNSVILIT